MEECVRLVDEVRRERLMREQPVAGERVGGERRDEEDQVDPMARDRFAPTGAQGTLVGPNASRRSWSAP
jgi:hypothetical protein